MGQAKEVERGPTRLRVACALCPLGAEVDEACLVGMQCKPKPCKTLAQHRQDASSVDDVVERHHRVISKPDKGAVPREAWLHLRLEPLIEHVVQEDVREARRDYTSLRSALGHAAQESVFDSSCLQPFVDHPSDNAICDSLVEERPKVGVWNRIEILAYIDLKHPVEAFGPDRVPQAIECLVSRAAWSEAVRARQEVLLIYRLQHHRHG